MTHTVRFTYEYDLVEIAREYLQHWCRTGLLPGGPLPGYVVWFGTVIDDDGVTVAESGAIIRNGRSVYIDEDLYFEWLRSGGKRGAA